MAERKEYQMVGRYNKGNEITAYALTNTSDGTTKKYSKEQVVLLVGRGQVDKVDGQVYKDDVLLRGIGGFSINKLPTKVDMDAIENTDEASETVAGEPNPSTYFDVPPILRLDAVAKRGRSVIAYLVFNKMKNTSKALSRQKVIKLASEKKIENAYTQKDSRSEGGLLLRGLGCSLNDLRPMTPEEMEENGIKVKKKVQVEKSPVKVNPEAFEVGLAAEQAAVTQIEEAVNMNTDTITKPTFNEVLKNNRAYIANIELQTPAGNEVIRNNLEKVDSAYSKYRIQNNLVDILEDTIAYSDISISDSQVKIRADYSYIGNNTHGGFFVISMDRPGKLRSVESTIFTSEGGDPDFTEVYGPKDRKSINQIVDIALKYIAEQVENNM